MAVDLKRFDAKDTCNVRPLGREDMNIVIVGHVDHGKSTIIGRLLADTGSLPKGKLEQIQELCRRTGRSLEYAFLLDALKDEQEQGITIDSARVFFYTAKRRYVIIDAPGHLEFLKNMVTGASRAEAALLVIDATEGIKENTKRHGTMLSMLGIRQLSVLINKMDLVDYDERRFNQLVAEYRAFLESIGLTASSFLPVSGMKGDNISGPSAATPWYRGPSVLEVLDAFESQPPPVDKPFRMPVQAVYRFSGQGDRRRIVAGTVETGRLRVGDRVRFYPSGKESRVKTIEAFNVKELPREVSSGQAVGFTLEEQIYVRRGEIATIAGQPAPRTAAAFRTSLFWLGKNPMVKGKTYLLKLGTAKVDAWLEEVREVIDASSLERTSGKDRVDRHDVAECTIRLGAPIAFDLASEIAATSRFVIVDDYEISGGGIIQAPVEEPALRGAQPKGGATTAGGEQPSGGAQRIGGLQAPVGVSSNIRRHTGLVSYADRCRVLGQAGLVLWFTGLSGSGKSTIAAAVERRLNELGRAVYWLDGDAVRHGLCSDLGFSPADRDENIRRVAEVAALFKDAGLITLVSFISPFARMRAFARERAGDGFALVYVKADVQTCIERDPKGLYQKALRGEIPDFTGISSPYEEPDDADLVLDTARQTPEECVEAVVSLVLELQAQALGTR